MSDYEKYLLQQQAERGRVYNDMTLDERLTEFIEYWHSSTERHLAIDAHLEIIKLRAENDRLKDEMERWKGGNLYPQSYREAVEENARLLAANEQAADELAEALYNLRLMTKQADANHKRAKDAEEQLRKYQIVTVARRCTDSDRDCEGDGSGPSCENAVVWEIQAMDDSGSHYAYVCADHLSDYQKWAHDDGRLPMVFELEDEDEGNDN